MRHNDFHPLLPADAAWLALERPGNPMTITILMRVEGLAGDRLNRFLRIYWLAWERLSCIPVRHSLGWCWERDPTFSLRHHVEVCKEGVAEARLEGWVSERLNDPLPDYRPRWKFWLVPVTDGDDALLLRIHHCYGDGLALMEVFEKLSTPSPLQAPVFYGQRESNLFGRWWAAADTWVRSALDRVGAIASGEDPLTGLKQALDSVAVHGRRFFSEVADILAQPKDTADSFHRPLLGRRNCRYSAPVQLAWLRETAGTAGCTVNDLLLACVTAAARSTLSRGSGDLLDDAVFHASMPVDIRQRLLTGLRPGPGDLGNFFGTVFVPLPVSEENACERLRRIRDETLRLKQSWQPGLSWGLVGMAGFLPPPWRPFVTEFFDRRASVVVSNVPGAPEPRYLAGCRISEQLCWTPQAGRMGLGVSIVSYAGQVQFGVVADAGIMAEPEQFLEACLEALDEFPGAHAELRAQPAA